MKPMKRAQRAVTTEEGEEDGYLPRIQSPFASSSLAFDRITDYHLALWATDELAVNVRDFAWRNLVRTLRTGEGQVKRLRI